MPTVCISASTLYYPKGGGHMWVFLNWALGFMKNGTRVIWLEKVYTSMAAEKNLDLIVELKKKLKYYNLTDVAIWQTGDSPVQEENYYGCISFETAAKESDFLINQDYYMPGNLIERFRKSALLDIDPGLLQYWISEKIIQVAQHDYYFTIGETVGLKNTRIPDCGLNWIYIPPCVFLDYWPVRGTSVDSPFTTVTHWSGSPWELDNDKPYNNDKKEGFLPFLALPMFSTVRLELAVLFGENEKDEERFYLENNGWKIKDSHQVAGSPEDYQNYIQQSAGEFSCVKPSCLLFQNAWISDRTLCYLASGKPAVVQYTGPSKFLPDSAGLLRFKNFDEAVSCLEEVAVNYDMHAKMARALAEEYFDAVKVTRKLLDIVFNTTVSKQKRIHAR